MSGTLLIARHHESEWNKKGIWTGTRDVHLTPYGFEKSKEMGLCIKDVRIDAAFASTQIRSLETLTSMLEVHTPSLPIPTEKNNALNERDYGDYTGKNKWDMKQLVGEKIFEEMRRGWDYPIPNGETLKTVYERVVPFYLSTIVPLLSAEKNVLIVAHGNSIRALMMYIEQVPHTDVGATHEEMLFGAIVLYDVDTNGHMRHKEVRQIESAVDA